MKNIRFTLTALCIFISFFYLASFVYAWDFYGYTYDINGIPLNHTLINITVWSMGGPGGPSLVQSFSNYSNESGWFNFSVVENISWMYKPILTHTNETSHIVDWVGKSLPMFPFQEFNGTTNIKFYLSPAGTINITAINRTGSRINFSYQIKDTRLGYPIAENFNNAVSEAIIYVPRDRNYSISIYPQQALPVTFYWNNFSSTTSYQIVPGLAEYNATTHTLQKTFNCTEKFIRVTGYLFNGTSESLPEGWDEFTVVPFLLEPGNMVYLGEGAGMPYNMSAWSGQSDEYNLTSGWYNITLLGPEETVSYLLFATARNGSSYYGGYRNITLNYSSSSLELNFSMYPLMSTDWGSANSNITLNDANGGRVNISTARQQFNLVNSSNDTLNIDAHIEITLDYTDFGATEFSFMTDITSGNATFYLPLLNASIKEMNIFSQAYAPKRVSSRTASQILSNPNITMSQFNPRDIAGSLAESNIFIKLMKSNETCNVPNPPSSCAAIPETTKNNFRPLAPVIGGGKLNFRMGYGGIEVMYVN
ncbi:hypothetical protein DRN69_06185, partial [Candidatus Pacearchaeota archaeon]